MKKLFSGVLMLTFIACNGGGGGQDTGNGDGAPGFTHNQLAEKFIQELNLDADFDVTIAKRSTIQSNFVVIFDPLTNSYDAINIDNYDPAVNTSAADYYYDSSARSFFDLDLIPSYQEVSNTYTDSNGYTQTEYRTIPEKFRDRASDLYFEKITATPKDLAKMSAIKEAHSIQKSAEFLSAEFGLSLNRSKEIASLTNHWKKVSKKGMSASETDKFATELLGFSLSQGINAYKDSLSGDSNQLDSLIDEAASANDITPEHATQLMHKVFNL